MCSLLVQTFPLGGQFDFGTSLLAEECTLFPRTLAFFLNLHLKVRSELKIGDAKRAMSSQSRMR